MFREFIDWDIKWEICILRGFKVLERGVGFFFVFSRNRRRFLSRAVGDLLRVGLWEDRWVGNGGGEVGVGGW